MADFLLGASALAAGYRLQGHDSIGSTNAVALTAATAGSPGKLWIAARQQTAGRGRRGRSWSSPYGNLAASLLLLPEVEPAVAATLGFVAGVALSRTLADLLPQGLVRIGINGTNAAHTGGRIALKWPNDVLADDAKLAGILLEAGRAADGRQAVVVGIGINIVAAPEGLAYPATSIAALGISLTAEKVFETLSDAWVDAFTLWDEGRGVPAVLDRWRASATGLGAPVAITQDGETLRGIFETIDEAGRLIVRANDNRRIAIAAGDVHFGATASARS